ncbi:hypothetical protein GCM10027341_17580 [Spirosoma knui]
MNDPRKFRLLIGLIIGLVLLNVALLAWFGPLRQGRVWRGAGERGLYLSRQLNFSDEQRERYQALRQRYFEQRQKLNEQVRPERREFFEQVYDTTKTDAELLTQAQEYHTQLAQLDVITLRHFQQVATICTPEQREKLRKIVSEMPSRGNWEGRRGRGNARQK